MNPVSDTLSVRQVGTGPPLVLLHGLLVTGAMFDPLVDAWSARYRLVIPDLPGPYPVDLLDRLDLPRAHVLGYSHGGTVAQRLAYEHPDRVDRLVLACTYACNRDSRRERVEGWLSPWLLATLGPVAMAGLAARAGGGPALTRGQAAALRGMVVPGRRRAVAAYRELLDFDSRPWLARIAAPTLVVYGPDDRAVPRRHAETLAGAIPRAELCAIGGGGHFLAWTHTARFADAVARWLDRP